MASRAPSLRETQERLYALITAPEGVRPGLLSLGLDERALAELVRGDQRRSAVERLEVYASMYFFRLLDALRDDFPTVAAAIGDAPFHDLITDYLLACPPAHPSIRDAGARLPAFLDGHPLAGERPWLGDLARLEWARLEVFDAPDAPLLTVETLRGLAPEAFAALALPLIPAQISFRAQFAVDGVWSAVAAGVQPTAPASGARALLVWRRAGHSYHRALAELESAALALAALGRPFGAICDLVSERVPVDEAPRAAFELLLRWVSDGLVAAA